MLEFAAFYDVIGWAKSEYGFDIDLEVGGFQDKVKSAFLGTEITADKRIDAIDVADYDALAIPGGDHTYGYFEEAYDERFLDLIRKFNAKGKAIASICVGALPIGKSGVLSGRNATTYHLSDGYRQKELASFGVNVISEPIVVDANVITSYCPSTANEVAFLLSEKLLGKEMTDVIRTGMGW